MSNSDSTLAMQGERHGGDHGDGHSTEQAVYHVNDRKGRVDSHGQDLSGREILSRVGLNAEKYELWTIVDGRTGEEIKPDETRHVKPGDHFRATIRGTDYSSPRRWRNYPRSVSR